MRQLRLKHRLNVLTLLLQLSMHLLGLHIQLTLEIGNVLVLLRGKLNKLGFHLAMLLHQALNLTFKKLKAIRNIILLHCLREA